MNMVVSTALRDQRGEIGMTKMYKLRGEFQGSEIPASEERVLSYPG